jgi:ATP-dependent DNA helicase RecQ
LPTTQPIRKSSAASETGVRARPPMASANGRNSKSITDESIDPDLREYLREWRRSIANELGFPAFVIMHDTTLEELCRRQPSSLEQIRQVPGFGVAKTQTYGLKLIEALNKFRAGARAEARSEKMSRPAIEVAN